MYGITSNDLNKETRADWEMVSSKYIKSYYEMNDDYDDIEINATANLLEVFDIFNGVEIFYEQTNYFNSSKSILTGEDIATLSFATNDRSAIYINKMKTRSDIFKDVTGLKVLITVNPP